MGVKLNRPVLEINAVRPGATAVITVPTLGPRYFNITPQISAAGQVLNQIVDEFRFKLGTKVHRKIVPDYLNHVLLLMAEAGSTRYTVQNNTAGADIDVPFHFYEPWRKSYAAALAMALPTGGVDQATIEIDISATADASVAITCTAEYDNPTNDQGAPMPLQAMSKIFEQDVAINGLDQSYLGLEVGPRDSLQSLHFFDEGTIDKVEFLVGNITVREVLRQVNNSSLTRHDMTTHADWFDLVFDDDDDPFSALPLNGAKPTMRLTLNDGTPRTIPLVVQRIGPRE